MQGKKKETKYRTWVDNSETIRDRNNEVTEQYKNEVPQTTLKRLAQYEIN